MSNNSSIHSQDRPTKGFCHLPRLRLAICSNMLLSACHCPEGLAGTCYHPYRSSGQSIVHPSGHSTRQLDGQISDDRNCPWRCWQSVENTCSRAASMISLSSIGCISYSPSSWSVLFPSCQLSEEHFLHRTRHTYRIQGIL